MYTMSLKPQAIEDDWRIVTSPKNKRPKRSYQEISPKNGIKVNNAFDALSALDNDEEPNIERPKSANQTLDKKRKVPPIVVHSHVSNHTQAFNEIRKSVKDEYSIKAKSNRMIISTQNEHDYKVFIDKVKEAGIEYHTYTFPDRKPINSILRGLPANITTAEIQDALTVKNMKSITVKQFTKNVPSNDISDSNYINLPVYLATFPPETLISDIKKIKDLCYCKIEWERYNKYFTVLQCYNCQSFKHASMNCYRKAKCMICAGPHKTKECTNNMNIKCSNCGEAHKANSKECPVFLRITQEKDLRRGRRNDMPSRGRNNVNINNINNIQGKYAKFVTHGKSYKAALSGEPDNFFVKADGTFSLIEVLNEIKKLFSSINLAKIMIGIQKMVSKLKCCNDSISKISCIIECVMEIFD